MNLTQRIERPYPYLPILLHGRRISHRELKVLLIVTPPTLLVGRNLTQRIERNFVSAVGHETTARISHRELKVFKSASSSTSMTARISHRELKDIGVLRCT